MSRLIALAAACLLALPAAATAHEWFTGTRDPSTGLNCCGDDDCAVAPASLVAAGAITETDEGYIVHLTVDQARIFNKGVNHPITARIPWRRVAPSQTGGFAMCIFQEKIRCFFAPQNSALRLPHYS